MYGDISFLENVLIWGGAVGAVGFVIYLVYLGIDQLRGFDRPRRRSSHHSWEEPYWSVAQRTSVHTHRDQDTSPEGEPAAQTETPAS
jgi:hypothetical protein